jgi:hypothetical protein
MDDQKITRLPRRPLIRLRDPSRGQTPTYYAIWRHGFRAPKLRHDSLDAALAELDRLAQLNPDGVFDCFELRFVTRKGAA